MQDSTLHIAGVGRSQGGKYHEVSIDGSGTVSGEMICQVLDVNGHGKFHEFVQALSTNINGIATFDSQITGDKLCINGMATFRGKATTAESLEVNGRAKFHETVHAGRMAVNGLLTATDVEAERFEGAGSISISNLLNANRIDMRLVTKCTIGEIGCSTLVVRRNTGWILGIGGSGVLECPLIEGDDIDIEGVNATTVRGDNITIGEGCHIERVEYRGQYKVHPDAFVKEAVYMES